MLNAPPHSTATRAHAWGGGWGKAAGAKAYQAQITRKRGWSIQPAELTFLCLPPRWRAHGRWELYGVGVHTTVDPQIPRVFPGGAQIALNIQPLLSKVHICTDVGGTYLSPPAPSGTQLARAASRNVLTLSHFQGGPTAKHPKHRLERPWDVGYRQRC